MDNENKDLQGVEKEEPTLTPEEKVQEDIRSKIADAAAEVQDEIFGEAEEEDVTEENTELEETEFDGDIALEEEVKPEPVKITMKRSSFITSIIASVVAGALLLFGCMQVPKIIDAIPEGSTVAKVNGEKITDLDLTYYVYAEAAMYAQANGIGQEEMADFDWNQEVDGVKLADKMRENAINTAISEKLLIQKAAENGVELGEQEIAQIETQIAGLISTYGKDGLKLRARTMGIPTAKQYQKMYINVMKAQTATDDLEENPDSYYPEDKSVLSDYTQEGGASVKHILVKVDDEAAKEEKRAIAEEILTKANNGEDFDALVEEYNEDSGQGANGYSFGPGEMMPEFEEASFALKVGEISNIVETDYGFHIIKRIVGKDELQAYWRAEAGKGIKVKEKRVHKIDIGELYADVLAANDELSAEQSQQQ